MSKRTTPPDEVLKKEVNNGLNATSIGKKYGVSKVCVARHLVRLGLNRESPIGKRGSEHSMWKGGRGIKTGYMTVYNPKHHRASNIGRVFEHILIAEKKLGRPILKTEPIHHIDLDRLNNKPSNLAVLKSNSEHQQLHASLNTVISQLIKNKTIKFRGGKYVL